MLMSMQVDSSRTSKGARRGKKKKEGMMLRAANNNHSIPENNFYSLDKFLSRETRLIATQLEQKFV